MTAREQFEKALEREDEWSDLCRVVIENICGDGYNAYERGAKIMKAFCNMYRETYKQYEDSREIELIQIED